jgi:hypothetical protein
MTIPLKKLGINENYDSITPYNLKFVISKLLQKLIWTDCTSLGNLYIFPPDPLGNGVQFYKSYPAFNSQSNSILKFSGNIPVNFSNSVIQYNENECGLYYDKNLGYDLCLNPVCSPDSDGFYHTLNPCFQIAEGMCDPFTYYRGGECGGHYVPPIEFYCNNDKDDDGDGVTDFNDEDCSESAPSPTLHPTKKKINNVCWYEPISMGQLKCYSLGELQKTPCLTYPTGSDCKISTNAAKEGCYDNPLIASNDFCRKQFPGALFQLCNGDPNSSASSYCTVLKDRTDMNITNDNTDDNLISQDCTNSLNWRSNNLYLHTITYTNIASCPQWWVFPQSAPHVMENVKRTVDKINDDVIHILTYCYHDSQHCTHVLMDLYQDFVEFSHSANMSPKEILQYILKPLLSRGLIWH